MSVTKDRHKLFGLVTFFLSHCAPFFFYYVLQSKETNARSFQYNDKGLFDRAVTTK